MKWIAPVLLLCLAAASSADHLGPTPEDVAFTGRVSAVRDSDALLGGGVQLDDVVGGSYQLVAPSRDERSTVVPAAVDPPTIEVVDYSSRCGGLIATVGPSIAVKARGIDVETTDFDMGAGTDRYSVRGTGYVARPAPDLPFDVQVEVLLQDTDGEAALRGQALPRPGDLTAWDSALVTIVGCAFGTHVCTDASPRFEIDAVIDSLTTARSDTCRVTGLSAFDGEVRFDKMKSVLTDDTTSASVDSALFRSDGSLRLRIDAMTELVGQFEGGNLGSKHTRRRYEISSASEPALLSYIEAKLLELGATIVAEPDNKPATLEWTQPHATPEATLELRAHFRFDDPDGKKKRGLLILDVTQPSP